MPYEIFVIVVIAILAGTFSSVVKMIIGYLQSKRGANGEQGSLTESQLRRMIESSIDDSIKPLEKRFDTIEDRLNHVLEAPPEQRRLEAYEKETVDRDVS